MAQLLEKTELLEDLLDGKEISEEKFLAADGEFDEIKYELVNGRLESLGMSVKKVVRYGLFLLKLFEAYFVDNPDTVNGIVLDQFMISTKAKRYKNNYRRPDIMVVINDNLKDSDNKTNRMDIAIELISEGHKKRDHKDKKDEYRKKAVDYYLILDKVKEKSKFYQLNTNKVYEEIPIKELDIIELSLYKGLKFKLSDLFGLTDMESLANEPLYESSFGYFTKIGKERGIKIGKERGIKIGEERGQVKGIIKEKHKIAKKMKSEGMDTDMIQKMTGISKEEIEKL